MKLKSLTDQELISNFQDLVIEEQQRLVLQLEYLNELERRHLFFEYPSLWAYLVLECRMEESTALRRIRAARLMKKFPEIRIGLESGKLNLSLIELACATAAREKLSDPEFQELLQSLSGLSCRKAKREIATRYPSGSEIPHDVVKPLNEELSEIRFVANHELVELLEEIRGLLAHSHPRASYAELIQIVAKEYRERHHPEEKARRAADRATPPPTSEVDRRTPSQGLVHALVLRDGYRCSYVEDESGHKCTSTYGLEIDHRKSYSSGGKTKLENLRFLCQQHHRRVSFLEFGESRQYLKVT